MRLTIAYKPDCCNKAMLTKASAIRHEKKCMKNPSNKACPTCTFLRPYFETVYNPIHGGNPGSTDYDVLYFLCEADPDNQKYIKDEFGSDFVRDCENWAKKE